MSDSPESRDQINQREWDRLINWSGGRYSSHLDDLLWVPKKSGTGQALNFAHPHAKWFLAALCIFPAAVALILALA